MRYKYPAYVGAGIGASVLAALLGYWQKTPCSSGGAWNSFTGQFRDSCYTDIYPLYYNEGLAAGKVPYYQHPVEYPVLIGAMMQAGSWLVHSVSDPYSRGRDFYYVTVVMLAVCLLVGVLATAATADREGDGAGWAGWKAALLVALSPALILAAFVNWDLFAMALAAAGLAAWAAQRQYLAGALLGLAVATKFYPLLFFGALLLVCLRAGKMREFGQAFGAGAVAWLVVNLPVAIPATAGWARFYAFSRDRGADWGSVWYLFEHYNVPVLGNSSQGRLNLMTSGSFAVACVAIAVLALAAPRRPRLPQLCFLLLAAFLILNKVWSPQYVVWLVPLAVLSRPRYWWWYVVWQLAEIGYFFGIWGYFVNLYQAPAGLTANWYFVLLAARLLTVGVLAGTMVADMLHPERDRVRASGLNDDPSGGVLDGAPDRLVIVWGRDNRNTPESAEAAANLRCSPKQAGVRLREQSPPQDYTPCGLAAHTGTATMPLQYTGQYTDATTGLVYLRARYYAYAYVDDNPLNSTDLSGQSSTRVSRALAANRRIDKFIRWRGYGAASVDRAGIDFGLGSGFPTGTRNGN